MTGHSGPYPVTSAKLVASGETSDTQVIGRDTAEAAVDQPAVTEGRWVSRGGAVLEAAFADSLDVSVGDSVTLGGEPFEVVGVAVTAASAPCPGTSCLVPTGCVHGAVPEGQHLPAELPRTPGLVWLTQADARSLATDSNSLSHVR